MRTIRSRQVGGGLVAGGERVAFVTTLEPGDRSAVGGYVTSQGIQTVLYPVEAAVKLVLDPDEVAPEDARYRDDDRGRDPVRDGFHAFNIP